MSEYQEFQSGDCNSVNSKSKSSKFAELFGMSEDEEGDELLSQMEIDEDILTLPSTGSTTYTGNAGNANDKEMVSHEHNLTLLDATPEHPSSIVYSGIQTIPGSGSIAIPSTSVENQKRKPEESIVVIERKRLRLENTNQQQDDHLLPNESSEIRPLNVKFVSFVLRERNEDPFNESSSAIRNRLPNFKTFRKNAHISDSRLINSSPPKFSFDSVKTNDKFTSIEHPELPEPTRSSTGHGKKHLDSRTGNRGGNPTSTQGSSSYDLEDSQDVFSFD